MIGWLSGKIADKLEPGKLVIDVNGVGYDVETSLPTFFALEATPDAVGLHIHTVVREDALLLYGFSEKKERGLFRELIKVNGIGPRIAIAILSSTTPDEFITLINQQNTIQLTKLPGIGKKTAERLAIEMKDRLADFSGASVDISVSSGNASEQKEAIIALEALGYKAQQATKVVRSVSNDSMRCEEIIRASLKHLAGALV